MPTPASPAGGSQTDADPPPPVPATRRRRLPGTLREQLLFLALVLPNLALLGVCVYRPLNDNIRLSFFDWNISSPTATFIGWSNYVEWWNRPDSWVVVQNTLVFTLSAVIGSMVLGLALALLLDQQLVGRGLVRSAVFAPFVIAGAAIGVAFQFIFDPRFGMISALLTMVGLPVPNFYQDPEWAMVMVTVTYIWKNLGYSFVIYLAALQAKPAELYEAAEMDGAGAWTTFRKVTLPLLRPTTFFLSITVLLNSLQVFDIIYVMTRGGPQGNGTSTMVFQVYQETFQNFRAGYGATVATIMFLVLLLVTAVQVKIMDRKVT